MRVIIEYDDPTSNYGEGACDVDHLTEWGETEDYSVTVVEAVNNPDNFSVLTTSESCVDENDGIINVAINQTEFTYQVKVSGPSINIIENLPGTTYTLPGLAPGDYEICFFIEELNYTQCFEVSIGASEQIALKVASKKSNTYSFNINSGTAPYKVYLNEELLSVSDNKEFELEIFGSGKLEVKTAKDCEGFYKTSIGKVLLKQNPVSDSIDLLLPVGISKPNINATIFDLNGKMIYSQRIKREQNTLSIPFKEYAVGIYILKLSIENSKPIKIIKQ
jgi:hypothetical protein